tara:strand:+ start:115 stop:1626 length:1512 start_codon:yes stop_codon:yes gene_type:complete
MAALGSQSIASSYEQLLHVDANGGGDGTNHVSVKDGDNGTTFGFTIASDALMMSSTNRLEFGDNGTYIHQSADGVLDLVSDSEIEINATTIDVNGAMEVSGDLTLASKLLVPASAQGIFGSADTNTGIRFEGSDVLAIDTGGTERLTIDSSGGVYINDNANANMTIGLTINQGANDDHIFALKSSDVAHGRTSEAETDTYGHVKKTDGNYGGLKIVGISEDHASSAYSILMEGHGGQAETGKTDGSQGLFQIYMSEHDGSNSATNINANGNVFAIRGRVGGGNRTLFIVDEDGDIHYDGSDAGAYDYAEMFEWADGNPDNEDRAGYSVSLVGDKIKKSEEGETPIGIVSVKPAVCGDSPLYWKDKWKRDEWGRKIYKEVPCVKFEIQHESEPATYYQEGDDLPEGKEVGDEKTAAVYITKEKHYEGDGIPDDLPDDAESYTKLESQYSDGYDDSQEYINRKERQEWDAIGLMGKLRMHSGQPTASSWIKMKDEGNNIEMWLVK